MRKFFTLLMILCLAGFVTGCGKGDTPTDSVEKDMGEPATIPDNIGDEGVPKEGSKDKDSGKESPEAEKDKDGKGDAAKESADNQDPAPETEKKGNGDN